MSHLTESHEPMWDWFSLSYAGYMVFPRIFLCSLPLDLQRRFAAILEEIDEHAPKELPAEAWKFTVMMKDKRGKFTGGPWTPYRHRTMDDVIAHYKPEVQS